MDMKMKFYKYLSLVLCFILPASVFAGCEKKQNAVNPDDSIELLNFDNAEILLDNPDRGLRMETYITLGDPLYSYPLNEENPFDRAQRMIDKYKSDSPALCQVYVYLSNYCDRELDELAFEQLKEYFELFRKNNIRMLLRFAYGTEDVDDAPYDIVKKHIEQLDRWFDREEELINDTLYCLQTGIIGYWGEGHSFINLDGQYIPDVIADVCDLAPEGIFTQVRTYDMLKAVDRDDYDMVGIHDDYIIGDMSHEWSFVPKRKFNKFNKSVIHSRHTINDGEMPWGSAKLDDSEDGAALNSLDGKQIINQLYTYSMTSFSLEHNYREKEGEAFSMEKWKNQFLTYDDAIALGVSANPALFKNENGESIEMSIYDFIRYHLGYQLVLSNYSVTDKDEVKFTVTNYGFAAPLNFNYFAVVFKDNSTGKISECEMDDFDSDKLQSGCSVKYSMGIPENSTPVGVKMETFKGRGISPRFANATEFENGIQYFE